jgi:hypothetical protein
MEEIDFSTIAFFLLAVQSNVFRFPQNENCGKLVEKFSENLLLWKR